MNLRGSDDSANMKLVPFENKGWSEREGWSSEAVVVADPGRHDDQQLEQQGPIRRATAVNLWSGFCLCAAGYGRGRLPPLHGHVEEHPHKHRPTTQSCEEGSRSKRTRCSRNAVIRKNIFELLI